MDFCFFIPLQFGCPSKIKQEGTGEDVRVCPRCHNASVITAKSSKWFEFCFVPLIPLGKKHLWYCHICQWSSPVDAAFQPPAPGGFGGFGGGGGGGGPQHYGPGQFQQPGYGVAYHQQGAK